MVKPAQRMEAEMAVRVQNIRKIAGNSAGFGHQLVGVDPASETYVK
jgi:5,10-methylene-tetrahydrofolate dehydrogenase/methenyl tetrahydrofolate cyclohydrolase